MWRQAVLTHGDLVCWQHRDEKEEPCIRTQETKIRDLFSTRLGLTDMASVTLATSRVFLSSPRCEGGDMGSTESTDVMSG